MVRFIDFASLTATGPTRRPHVIDIAAYNQAQDDDGYNIWDAVATLLHTISPDTLRDFLDFSKNEVRVIVRKKNASNINRLLIWRKGLQVLIADFKDAPEDDLYEWGNVVRCQIHEFSALWRIGYGGYDLLTRRAWPEIWAGQVGKGVHGAVYTTNSEQDRTQVKVARLIMSWCPWSADEFEHNVLYI